MVVRVRPWPTRFFFSVLLSNRVVYGMFFASLPPRVVGDEQCAAGDEQRRQRQRQQRRRTTAGPSIPGLSTKVCLDDEKERALLSLLTHLVKDKCFDQLRTKEQLG